MVSLYEKGEGNLETDAKETEGGRPCEDKGRVWSQANTSHPKLEGG